MMRRRAFAVAAAFTAALALAACSNDDDDEPVDDTTPVEDAALDADAPAMDADAPAMDADAPAMDADAPAMDADAPAMDADAPAMDADAPAMDADAPAMDAPAAEVDLADFVGTWAETADACGVNELVITEEEVILGEETCIVAAAEAADGGLGLTLLCPVEGAEPGTTTWTIAAVGDAPYTEINITNDDATTTFVACAAE